MLTVTLCLFALVSCSPSFVPEVPDPFPVEALQAHLDGLRDRQRIVQAAQSQVQLDADVTEAETSNTTSPAFYFDQDKLVYDLSWLHETTCHIDSRGSDPHETVHNQRSFHWPTFGTFSDNIGWRTEQHLQRDNQLRFNVVQKSKAVDFRQTDMWPTLHAGTQRLKGLTPRPIINIISLPSAYPRRHRMAEMVKRMNIDAEWRWMPAVDGRAIPNALIWVNQSYTPWHHVQDEEKGKYGAYLSHQACLESRDRETDVIVLEDDSVLDPDFVARWNRLYQVFPSDWDIALLGSSSLIHVPFYETKDYIRTTFSWGAYGYIVRNATAPRMLRLLQTNRKPYPIDIIMGQFNVLPSPHHSFVTVLPQYKLVETNGAVHTTEDLTHGGGNAYRYEADLPHDTWSKPYLRPYCRDSKSRKYCTKEVAMAWQNMVLAQ